MNYTTLLPWYQPNAPMPTDPAAQIAMIAYSVTYEGLALIAFISLCGMLALTAGALRRARRG